MRKTRKKQLEDIIEDAVLVLPKTKLQKLQATRFEDDFEEIVAAYNDKTGKIRISETLENQKDRWFRARELFLSLKPVNDMPLVERLMSQYNISETQARTDCKNMKRFFGSVETVVKEYEKVAMIEDLKQQIKRLESDGSIKAEAIALKCRQLLSKIMGFDLPENHAPVPVFVEINQVYDPNLLGMQKIDNLENVIKNYLNKKSTKKLLDVEDVAFEDLVNNPYQNEKK
jgi:hypothetical protein